MLEGRPPSADQLLATPGQQRRKKDTIENTNIFCVNRKGGARPIRPSASLLWHLCFPRADLIPLAPSTPRSCTRPGSGMAFELAEKIDGKRRRALRTPDDDMSFAQGYLRDVLEPRGVLPSGRAWRMAVKLSGKRLE